MSARLVLASASPARLATLRRAGVEPQVVVSGVDETDAEASTPAGLADLLARRKARAVAQRLTGRDARSDAGPALVLGCDSVLELDGEAHGKPAGPEEAAARWRRMRGRTGVLHTGHCLIEMGSGQEVGQVAATLVRFADVSDEEIAAYVATGEPLGVAGAFTLDGLGGAFVEGVDGDPSNVVGLSLPLLRRLLASVDVGWTELWSDRGDGR